jgi:hypothetical protein
MSVSLTMLGLAAIVAIVAVVAIRFGAPISGGASAKKFKFKIGRGR